MMWGARGGKEENFIRKVYDFKDYLRDRFILLPKDGHFELAILSK